MNALYYLSILIAAAAVLTLSVPAHAGKMDSRIEVSAKQFTAQVNMTLLNHRSTSVLNTTVKTKHGVVTVGGKARNMAEKALVTKLVTDINGVTGVRNRMTID